MWVHKNYKKTLLACEFQDDKHQFGSLDLDLHSSSHEPVNFFRAQSSLGRAQAVILGARPWNAPRGAGHALMGTRGWFQRSGSSSFQFLLAEGDSVERSDRNVLQGAFCFQLSTAFSSTVTFRLQRWSSQRHIFKSLASKLQVLKNCPVLGLRTAVCLESSKIL